MAVVVTRETGQIVEYEAGVRFEVDDSEQLYVFEEQSRVAVFAAGFWSHAEVKP